jgi:hypothetical protein
VRHRKRGLLVDIYGRVGGLPRLLFEDAAELAASGLEAVLLLLRVAVVDHRPSFLQHVQDEFFHGHFSRSRSFN